LHVGVFVFSPTFRATPLAGSGAQPADSVSSSGAPIFVEVLFEPPTILLEDGGAWTEPPDRVLNAGRGIELPGDCLPPRIGVEGRIGEVRLQVKASGRVKVLGLSRSSGNACLDGVLRTVAGDLWYHWLPNSRFPAPVDLFQPIRISRLGAVLR
jgi:hypothetical protein